MFSHPWGTRRDFRSLSADFYGPKGTPAAPSRHPEPAAFSTIRSEGASVQLPYSAASSPCSSS